MLGQQPSELTVSLALSQGSCAYYSRAIHFFGIDFNFTYETGEGRAARQRGWGAHPALSDFSASAPRCGFCISNPHARAAVVLRSPGLTEGGKQNCIGFISQRGVRDKPHVSLWRLSEAFLVSTMLAPSVGRTFASSWSNQKSEI